MSRKANSRTSSGRLQTNDQHEGIGQPDGLNTPLADLKKKNVILDVYMLAICLGFFGAHHFYLKRRFFGWIYLFTFGLFGIGYIIDLFRIPRLVADANKARNPNLKEEKSLSDAYLLWFAGGFLGLHQLYLRRKVKLVFLYTFTGGIFGIGWLVDLYQLPFLVRRINGQPPTERNTCTAYIQACSPFGMFGAHHFYLHRSRWGWLYLFTAGIFGIGWIVDLIRLPTLVKRANGNQERMYLDDAYILWLLPLGLLGAHQFYLKRPFLGKIYLVTFGLFGVGWLMDLFRMYWYVKEFNMQRGVFDNLPDTQQSTDPHYGNKYSNAPSPYHKFPVRRMIRICDRLDRRFVY